MLCQGRGVVVHDVIIKIAAIEISNFDWGLLNECYFFDDFRCLFQTIYFLVDLFC